MQITLQKPALEKRTFEIGIGDLLLILRAREQYPILGIFKGVFSQRIDRVRGRSHERRRFIIQPALTLNPCATIYGKIIPEIKFQENLSFSLGTEIGEIKIGIERILEYFTQREELSHYAEVFSHLPNQGPYDPNQFLY